MESPDTRDKDDYRGYVRTTTRISHEATAFG
jgi:hypothetical protein